MYLGSLYVNSFNQFGRQPGRSADPGGGAATGNQIDDIALVAGAEQVGADGALMGTLVNSCAGGRRPDRRDARTTFTVRPPTDHRRSMRPGVGSGDAIAAINRVSADSLPLSMRAEFTELMFLQIRAGNTALYVFALAAVSVFLALAALYESWTLPLAVILVVPLCLLCSVAGVLYTGREVNIFVQIGLVVLVGLACKNAILIVEYAKQLHQEGRSRYEATVEACRLRLRPILMTSFAFIFGVTPLVVASGAGAEMRRSLGIAVFSGMLGVDALRHLPDAHLLLGHPGVRRGPAVPRPPPRGGEHLGRAGGAS